MPRRPANRRWGVPSRCGGSRAAAAVADNLIVPLEPESTVVARLAERLAASPEVKRIVVHGDWHPSMGQIEQVSAGLAACVYAVHVTDTCKEVENGLVVGTLPRESLVIASGPWVFTREALEGALATVAGRESSVESVPALCEQSRLQVRVLPRP